MTNEERASELVREIESFRWADSLTVYRAVPIALAAIDGADARGYARGRDKLLIEFGKFRGSLRQILAAVGVSSNSGWSDDDVLAAIRSALFKGKSE